MSWDETLALLVIYTLHPTAGDNCSQLIEGIDLLSFHSNIRVGLDMNERAKFITVRAVDLKPSEIFMPLHWFVLHRQTLLHTSPVQKRQQL
jgi:hypothetical protein